MGRRPGAEILRRDVLAGDLAQIIVHVGRVDVAPLALLVDVLEQLVARQVAAILDDAGEPAVVDVGFVALAAFAAEADVDVAALDRDVAVAQRRQPEALVRFRVFGVADADQRHFHQADDRRQNLFARQAAALQIGLDAGADQRQDAGEGQQLGVFRLVAHLAPARMIAVLLAPLRVAAGRLQMAVRVRGRSTPRSRPAGSPATRMRRSVSASRTGAPSGRR